MKLAQLGLGPAHGVAAAQQVPVVGGPLENVDEGTRRGHGVADWLPLNVIASLIVSLRRAGDSREAHGAPRRRGQSRSSNACRATQGEARDHRLVTILGSLRPRGTGKVVLLRSTETQSLVWTEKHVFRSLTQLVQRYGGEAA